MRIERGPVPIDLARELVEEVLIAASRLADVELQAAFRDEREAAQGIETVDIREKHLDALDTDWMERLRVVDALHSVLLRQPDVAELVSTCFLTLARAKEDEKAFLYSDDIPAGSHAGKPALVVQLTAETLLAVERLEALVRTTLTKARRAHPGAEASSPRGRQRETR